MNYGYQNASLDYLQQIAPQSPVKKKETKNKNISARLSQADNSKLENIGKLLGTKSKAKIISYLLEYYDESKYPQGNGRSDEITIQMHKYNYWTQHQNIDQSKLKIYQFRGTLVYNPDGYHSRGLSSILCESLKKDFGVCIDPQVCTGEYEDAYLFSQKLEVYFDRSQETYLVYEQMEIQLNFQDYYYLARDYGWVETPFHLRRCNHVKDYNELVFKFRRYAFDWELREIGNVIGTSIGSDLSQMDELF